MPYRCKGACGIVETESAYRIYQLSKKDDRKMGVTVMRLNVACLKYGTWALSKK